MQCSIVRVGALCRLSSVGFHTSCKSFHKVELTSVRYPEVKRGSYATLTDKDVSVFEKILGNNRVVTNSSDLESYNTDWLKIVRGASQCLLKPKTTEEVSAILKHCNTRRLAVCPQGGNTGLVGGSVPVFDEIVVSLQLMNKVIDFDSLTGVLKCESGCILESLDQMVREQGFIMPLDLGAKGSCQIGGNLSTNAGGIRYLRYGGLHGTVLGTEAVLADGTIMDCMSYLKKDNTGFDLKHLFIGSEGLLGVVTKASIQCPAKSSAVHVTFLGLEKFEQVLQTFSLARKSLGEILSSCEFMDNASIQCATQNLGLRSPIQEYPFYMLLETSGSDEGHDGEKLAKFLEAAMEEGIVQDGTMTSQPSHMVQMWQLRERIAEGLLRDGYCYKYDLSIPLLKFYNIVSELRERLGPAVIRCCGYGHVGDANLHLNVTTKEYNPEVTALIEPWVYEWTAKVSGSISAEHGLGFKKRNCMHYSKKSEAIHLMKLLKQTIDPNNILNPYKVLPD